MSKFHADNSELTARMKKCLRLAGPWANSVYRFVTVPYANRQDLLSGAGSRLHGGRWNPPGVFNVVYGSLNEHTAMSESLGTYNGFGVPPAQARPRVFVAITFRLQNVLDLTSTKAVSNLGLNFPAVLREDWKAIQDAGGESTTQAIGRIAWELDLEAIIVPSAVSPGPNNIAVFPSRRMNGSSWKIQGARDLPGKK